MSDYDAEENVSEIAITDFMSQRSIQVNDVNYGAFRETYTQLQRCISWSHLLQTRYNLLHIEKNGLFTAHMNLLKTISLICASSGDILPLAPLSPTMQPPNSYIEHVIYIGPNPPETRHEELSRELFNVLQEYTPMGNPMIS
jgi:hypothetical protein